MLKEDHTSWKLCWWGKIVDKINVDWESKSKMKAILNMIYQLSKWALRQIH